MVQRKATQKLSPKATRSEEVITEHKKKMKLERSVIAANLLPNYMKPTKSSTAKNHTVKDPKPIKKQRSLNRQSSLKGVKFLMNRATCSSTLKDSKFPKALDLSFGATEAEGTSAVKVCPYSYCSLNGHRHQALVPLKRFVSAKRKLLSSQKKKEEVDTGQKVSFVVEIFTNGEEIGDILHSKDEENEKIGLVTESSGVLQISEDDKAESKCFGCSDDAAFSQKVLHPSEDLSSDFFVKIYTNGDVVEVVLSEDDIDSFHKFIRCGEQVEKVEEEKTIGLVAESSGKFGEADTKLSECSEDDFGLLALYNELILFEQAVKEDGSNSPSDELLFDTISEHTYACKESISELSEEGESRCITNSVLEDFEDVVSYGAEDTETEDDLCEGDDLEHDFLKPDDVPQVRKIQDHSEDYALDMNARWRITRKTMIEEMEDMKEFNPRGPNFLPLEPDPEGEKVDLRHQMMDERKNSEEWMVDYALRCAVMKLAPAPKKKVELLVEAFETVAPLPAWRKPSRGSRHASSGLSHTRIIQACN